MCVRGTRGKRHPGGVVERNPVTAKDVRRNLFNFFLYRKEASTQVRLARMFALGIHADLKLRQEVA